MLRLLSPCFFERFLECFVIPAADEIGDDFSVFVKDNGARDAAYFQGFACKTPGVGGEWHCVSVLLDEPFNFIFVLARYENHVCAAFELVIDFLEVGHFVTAGRAPCCPDIYQCGFALHPSNADRFSVQARDGEVGTGGANF